MTYTTDAQYAATVNFDFSQAGSPLPAWVTDGTGATVFQDNFTDPTLAEIQTELPTPSPCTYPTIKWYTQKGVQAGAAATNEINIRAAGDPYSYNTDHLEILMSNPSTTQWTGGAMKTATYFTCGQQYRFGYFESDLLFPTLPGGDVFIPWESFFMIGGRTTVSPKAVTQPWPEFDAFESGLHNHPVSATQETTMHLHAPSPAPYPLPGQIADSPLTETTWTQNIFDGARHKYGVLVSHDYITYFFDRTQIVRIPNSGQDDMTPKWFMELQNIAQIIPDSTSRTFIMSVYAAQIVTPPAGSCYVLGGC